MAEIEFYNKEDPYSFIGVVVSWKQHYVCDKSHIPDFLSYLLISYMLISCIILIILYILYVCLILSYMLIYLILTDFMNSTLCNHNCTYNVPLLFVEHDEDFQGPLLVQ